MSLHIDFRQMLGDWLCRHDKLYHDCRRCQMTTLLCINQHGELPWLPKDVCKLIAKHLRTLYQWQYSSACISASAA